jgi:hypothetical protein
LAAPRRRPGHRARPTRLPPPRARPGARVHPRRRAWRQAAAAIQGYRRTYGISDPEQALGPVAASTTTPAPHSSHQHAGVARSGPPARSSRRPAMPRPHPTRPTPTRTAAGRPTARSSRACPCGPSALAPHLTALAAMLAAVGLGWHLRFRPNSDTRPGSRRRGDCDSDPPPDSLPDKHQATAHAARRGPVARRPEKAPGGRSAFLGGLSAQRSAHSAHAAQGHADRFLALQP